MEYLLFLYLTKDKDICIDILIYLFILLIDSYFIINYQSFMFIY